MRYARVPNNIAVDVRDTHPKGFFTPDIEAQFVVVPDAVQNGWLFDGTTYEAPPAPIPPTPAEIAAAAAAAVERDRLASIPFQVTMEQIRLALSAAELASIAAAFAALTDPLKTRLQTKWEYSATVMRTSPLTNQIRIALGKTQRQMDDIFTAAAAL